MTKKLLFNLTAFLLLVCVSVGLAPKTTSAFIVHDPGHTAVSAAGHGATAATVGADVAVNTISSTLDALERVLEGVPIEYGPTRTGLSTASTACEQIQGGFVTGLLLDLAGSVSGLGDQTKSTSVLGEVRTLILLRAKAACYDALTEAYQGAMTGGTLDDQLKQAFQDILDEIEQRRAPIKVQVEQIQSKLKISVQDIFKAIALGVAMAVNEKYTMNTLNEIMPQVTNKSFAKAIDATAAQVYAVEYIKKNYDGDQEKQLIMTSLLDTELVPDGEAKKQAVKTAKAMVEARLAEKCPQTYDLVNWENANIFTDAAKFVGDECNVDKNYDIMVHEMGHIMTESKNAAKSEVESGKGFLSTRSCKDVSAQEKNIRVTAAEAAKVLEDAKLKKETLEKANQMNEKEYIDAVNKLNKARADMKAVPQKVGGGVVVACGLIKDAGSFVQSQLDNYINQWLTQSTSVKDSNIPLYAQLAKTVTKKLFKGILFNPKQITNILTENGAAYLTTSLSEALTKDSDPSSPTSNKIPIDKNQITDSPLPGSGNNSGNVAGAVEYRTIPLVPYMSPRGF